MGFRIFFYILSNHLISMERPRAAASLRRCSIIPIDDSGSCFESQFTQYYTHAFLCQCQFEIGCIFIRFFSSCKQYCKSFNQYTAPRTFFAQVPKKTCLAEFFFQKGVLLYYNLCTHIQIRKEHNDRLVLIFESCIFVAKSCQNVIARLHHRINK